MKEKVVRMADAQEYLTVKKQTAEYKNGPFWDAATGSEVQRVHGFEHKCPGTSGIQIRNKFQNVGRSTMHIANANTFHSST